MKEIVFDSFKNTLQEVQILNDIVKKEKVSKPELLKGLKQARDLLFSSYSSLNIFSEAIKSEVSIGYKLSFNDKKQKKKVSKIEAKVIYNKLLSITKSELNKNIIVPKESLILQNQMSSMALSLFSASIDEDFQKYNSSFNSENLSLQELSKSINKYFEVIVRYIEDILLYDVFLIFEKPEITYLQEIKYTTDYKKEYIDKWLDCTVTFNELRRNKRTDHWAEIYKLKLEFEQTEKIENHQKKLFNERIDFEIRNAINDFDELEDDVKKEALNKEIKLIQDFFNSDTSKTVVKRLKNILNFSKPKEVVLEYDNILRDRLLLGDFNIYEVGKSNYSSAFVASFFMQYLDKLKEYLESLNDEVNNNKMINNQFQYDNFKDLLLVEELEKRIAIEAVKYKKNCDDLWETYTFDPKYFDTYISGDLYNVFLKSIYEKIKPLNAFEINKYLTLSVNQFKTHTPEKRAGAFKRIYHDTYWHPNQMEYNANEYDNKYAMHVWKHYTNHFQLFKDAAENVLQDFKNERLHKGSVTNKNLNHKQVVKNITKDIVEKINSINNFELILLSENEKPSVIITSEEVQSQYVNYVEKINTYIKEIYLDGDIAYLKRLLLTVNEYVTKWKKINSNDDFYLDIATRNEKYRHLTETIEVDYIIKTKLLFLSEIQNNLNQHILKVEPKKPKVKPKSKHQSFTYKNIVTGQPNLTDLKNALQRYNLISKDTDLKDFRKVFTNEPIDTPIVWTGNISELTYFIKQIHNELKYVANLKQQQWAVTTNCFIQETGERFDRAKFRGQKVPSTSKNIDSALNTLK